MSNSDGVGWLTNEVAGILRGAAARRGVTQARLGEVAGVSQSQVSKMLRGKRDITIDQLDWLCDELGLAAAEVLAEADGETNARGISDPLSPYQREVRRWSDEAWTHGNGDLDAAVRFLDSKLADEVISLGVHARAVRRVQAQVDQMGSDARRAKARADWEADFGFDDDLDAAARNEDRERPRMGDD